MLRLRNQGKKFHHSLLNQFENTKVLISRSVTTAEGSSLSSENEVAIARWKFNRARTEKEHAAFRERMQFQSADFHQFLAETARTSPKVAVPSPAWESIPFPIPVRTPTIVEEPDNQHSEMNASFDEIQEVPRRQATPMDFGLGSQQNQATLDVPTFSFDRPSFDDNIGSIELQSFPESELRTNSEHAAGDREAMITVGAVFELLRNPSDVRYPFARASNMAAVSDKNSFYQEPLTNLNLMVGSKHSPLRL